MYHIRHTSCARKLASVCQPNKLKLGSQRHFSRTSSIPNKNAWEIPERDLVERRSEKGTIITDILKVKREPFLKGLFMDQFDVEMLAFPEVLNKEQVDSLHEKLAGLGYHDEAFQNEPAREALQLGGVFGLEVPDQYGGLGYTMTEAARVLEATASTSQFQTLLAHNFLLQALLKAGSEEQKQRYLPALARGELTAAFCHAERTASSDLAGVGCSARIGNRPDELRLSGVKVGVPCGASADLLLVTANVQERDHVGHVSDLLSAVLVERTAGGITCTSCDPGLGTDLCDVEFKDTPVSRENVIGGVGAGSAVLLHVLNHVRTLYPAQVVGRLRPLVAMTTHHCLHRPAFGRHLADWGLTKTTLAGVCRDLYLLESLTYLTAGIYDLSEEPDYVLEAAVCKVTASELAQTVVDRCLRLLGDKGFYRREEVGDTAERYLKEMRAALRYAGSNELLRMFIALGGLQDSVTTYAEEVTKMRNPLLYPVHVLRRVVGGIRQGTKTAHKAHNLYAGLHPSLKWHADELERRSHEFADQCLEALERFGAELMHQQPALAWLAQSVSELYAMVAVLARCSRSYCIGLRDAETEIALATSVVEQGANRIGRHTRYLQSAPVGSPDAPLMKAADIVLQRGGYRAAHSLHRTY